MIGAFVAGTLLVWALYGRRRAALAPIASTQALLVLFVGHNLAILGLVEISAQLLAVLAEFVALTLLLAALFAFAALVPTRLHPTGVDR